MPLQLIITEPSLGPTDQTNRIARGDHHDFSYSSIVKERATVNVTFEIADADTYEPVVGSPVTYYETANAVPERIFAGKILERTPHWFASDNAHFVKLVCVGLESLFDTALAPAKAYLGWTVAAIVTDLVTPIIGKASTLIQLGFVIGSTVVSSLILDGTTYITDALNDLVTKMSGTSSTNWAWGVDVTTSPLPSFYFRPPESLGVTLTGNLLWDTFEYTQSEADLVLQVRITAGAGVFPPSCWTFVHPSPDSQVFTLPFTPSQVQAARLTWGRAPSAVLAGLVAIPIAGSTMTVGTMTYTFVSTIDNGVQNEILIGATVAANIINAAAAINADQSVGGVSYSWPTVENDLANAQVVSPGNFYVWSKKAGADGDNIAVNSTVVGLSFIGIDGFPASHLTGGGFPTPNGFIPQDVSLSCVASTDQSNITQPTLLYQAGVPDVTVLLPQLQGVGILGFDPDPVPVFWLLEVQYQRLGGSVITVENSALVDARAAIEHSSGQHQRSISVSSAADLASAYQAARKLLEQNSVIPYTLTFDTLLSGFHLYDHLFLSIPLPTTSLNGMQWIIQEIQGKYVPGLEDYPEYTVRRTIKAISGSLITKTNTYLDFWRGVSAPSAPPPAPLPLALVPQDKLNLTFQICDATISTDAMIHVPLPQSYEVRQIIVTPSIGTILAISGEFKCNGVSLFPYTIPAGTAADTQIIIPFADWATIPMNLVATTIPTLTITSGDEVKRSEGVFSIRLDVVQSGAS